MPSRDWLSKQGRTVSTGVDPISDTPVRGTKPKSDAIGGSDAYADGPAKMVGVGPSKMKGAPGMFSHLKLGPTHSYLGHFTQPRYLEEGHNDVPAGAVGGSPVIPGANPAPAVAGPSTPASTPPPALNTPATRPGEGPIGRMASLIKANAPGTYGGPGEVSARGVARAVGTGNVRANRAFMSGQQVNPALNPVLAAKMQRRQDVVKTALAGGTPQAVRAVRRADRANIREAKNIRRSENRAGTRDKAVSNQAYRSMEQAGRANIKAARRARR